MKKRFIDFLLVTSGAFIAAIGFNTMFLANKIASGGMVGLSVSFQELFNWNPSTFLLLTNVPLLILCLVLLGKETFIKTFYGSWIYPYAIKLTAGLPTLTHNPLLAAIFGGVIVGIGLGMVFWGNSSTGGTGIPTQILNKYTPLSLATAMTLVDGFSVAMGFVAFDTDTVMYSIIALTVISYVVRIMENGFNSSKNIMIISEQSAAIRQYITEKANRGVTQIPVLGGISSDSKTMLMATITSHELPKLQAEILKIDETAFIVVMPASQVMGRGFSLTKKYLSENEDILLPG
ncbi:YitT family protein [Streptococcus plurextorum]|uniref:YitT family protein n=1 Tax=Streptococcus plurextorum TaxID=456876 RepID=UPI00041FE6E8|nr:YitT family protein [Streptococcus plurextorum]